MNKKSALGAALNKRKQMNDEPEPQPEPKVQEASKPAKRRFHTTLYPDPELYRNIRIALLQEAEGRDFNQLVNDLLREWYEANSEQ